MSDIFTSRQTYFYEGENRNLSKISLIFLILFSVLIIVISFCLNKKETIEYFKRYHYLSFAFFSLIAAVAISSLINKNSFSSLLTYIVYIIALYFFVTSFSLISSCGFFKKEEILYFFVVIFYLYLCLCLFFYFYTIGKPMSSGNLRKPIISHIFFPCSLIPFFHRQLPFKKMLLIYLSFLPVLILANKMSVMLIFLAYVFFDIYESAFFQERKKVRNVVLVAFLLILFFIIIVSNVTKNNFLANTFSFDAFFLESGRLQNWITILSDLKNFSFINYLFGKGVGATLVVNYGTAAHNDFIEFLYDFGILGLATLVSLCISLVLFIKKNNVIREDIDKNLLFFYLFLFMLISTIFSNAMFLLFITLGLKCEYYDKSNKLIFGDVYEKTYWYINI